jgi:urea transport system ATP-binding protein
VILRHLSQQFAPDADSPAQVQDELRDYLATEIPLEELVPQLQTQDQRELALKLSYAVIRSNEINAKEAVLYQHLLNLLDLPPVVVERLETEALEDLQS